MEEAYFNVPKAYLYDIIPEYFPLDMQEKLIRSRTLIRILTVKTPDYKQMLSKNMENIDRALILGDRQGFIRLCKERRYIHMEWPKC